MGLAVVHIEVNRNRVDYIGYPSDMIRVGMRRHQEIELVYVQSSQAGHWTAPTRIYKRILAFRGLDEYGVSLSHIEECNPDRFTDWSWSGNATAQKGNKKNSRAESARRSH